jgi:transcriptional regulator with XRE-family HTH domain
MSALDKKRGGQILPVSLGNFVRKVRKYKRVEQGELAKRLGISQASLSRIESGGSEITFSRMMEMCVVLEVSIECEFIDYLGFFICVSGQKNISEGFYFDGIPF